VGKGAKTPVPADCAGTGDEKSLAVPPCLKALLKQNFRSFSAL